MSRKFVFLLPLAVVALMLVSGASAGQQSKAWPYPMVLSVSGPKTVAPNIVVRRYVTIRNNTSHVFRRVKVLFTPRSLIVHSSKRFKTITMKVYAPRTTARMIVSGIRPRTTRKIPMTLEFPPTAPGSKSEVGIILDGQELAKEGAFSNGGVVFHIMTTG